MGTHIQLVDKWSEGTRLHRDDVETYCKELEALAIDSETCLWINIGDLLKWAESKEDDPWLIEDVTKMVGDRHPDDGVTLGFSF